MSRWTAEIESTEKFGHEMLILVVRENGKLRCAIEINPVVFESEGFCTTAFLTCFQNLPEESRQLIDQFVTDTHIKAMKG